MNGFRSLFLFSLLLPLSVYTNCQTKNDLITSFHTIGVLQFGNFTFKSGLRSPSYIDMRLIMSCPSLLQECAHHIKTVINNLEFDVICPVPYGAVPLATAVSLAINKPMIMCRKGGAKDHGTCRAVEGIYKKGMRVLLIEDVITTGASILETIKLIEDAGLIVSDIVVIVDREQGGMECLMQKKFRTHSILKINEIYQTLFDNCFITSEQLYELKQWTQAHQYQ